MTIAEDEMIKLDGIRVRKDSVKEVIKDGSLFYVLTDDFLRINVTKDECMLVYYNCPKINEKSEEYKEMFKNILSEYEGNRES